MRPGQPTWLQAFETRLRPPDRGGAAWFAALLFAPLPVLVAPSAAAAQDNISPDIVPDDVAGDSVESAALPAARLSAAGSDVDGPDTQTAAQETGQENEREIAFEANALGYDAENDEVSASGDVILRSGDQSVRADEIVWNRDTGNIFARGNIRFVDEDGNQLFTDQLELTEELKAGAMTNLLLAFREGGRLAAAEGRRSETGDIVLERAVYSGCDVATEDGCPKDPSWRITAERVSYDAQTKRIRFRGAYFELFGLRFLPLPGLSVQADDAASSGLLVPDIGFTDANGLELVGSYFWKIAPDRDVLVSGHLFSDAAPMVSGRFRALADTGALQITGYLTHSTRLPMQLGNNPPIDENAPGEAVLRGYFAANGRFQLDDNWTVTGSARLASDRTFLRRYDISRDDRLRSMIEAERIDDDSYLSIAGWATQALLVPQPQGQVPIALPVIDYRRRLTEPVLGGQVELQANSLAISRTSGQDTQRAFTRGQWTLRRITGLGQEVTLTGLVRGDIYHTGDTSRTTTVSYRGEEGWQTRGIALGAVDVKWPLVGTFMGGTQVLTPRMQFVASPAIRNLAIPNEDARAIDLEDSNLFSLNRFPGYDRVEDGVRFTYGADWRAELPSWRISATIGQSFRLTDKPTLFPDGTGLTEKFSDFVGRTEVRYRNFVKFTHRFRLDKDSFAVRRNEIDAAFGSDRTYVEMGYLRLNRNIDASFEDLQDREELRAAGRISFARYWSVFGSAVVNLTDRSDDPDVNADGFELLRTRLGISYADDCFEFGATWRRDYYGIADADRGNSFRFYFTLRNFGLN